MKRPHIVKASKEDFNQIKIVLRREIYNEIKKEKVESMLKSYYYSTKWFVLKIEKKIEGVIGIREYDSYGRGKIYDIAFLAVNKKLRGRGYGEMLVFEALRRIRKEDGKERKRISMVFVQTDGENKHAISFYLHVLGKIGSVKYTIIKNVWPSTDLGNRDVVFIFSKINQTKFDRVLSSIDSKES